MLTKTNTKLKRRLTVAGLAAVAVAAIVPFASSSAYGPERKTFTMKEPAGYPTFNSITDNPALGDERNFVRIREAGTNDKFLDSVKVTAGKEYEVYVYFHNNAMSKLNWDETASGIAKDVRISAGLSTWTINSSKKSKVSAVISSTNTNPTEVWDEAYLETDSTKDIVMKYVASSATMHNGYEANGAKISGDYLFSKNGALIGEKELNGFIPGCAEYSGYITYRLKADKADSTVKKTVSKDGKNFYSSVDAKPGDTLTYKVEWKNTGTLDLTNVTFHDKLPSAVTLIDGTTNLVDLARPNGIKMNDIIGKNGFKTGNYGKDTYVNITYQVKVNDNAVDSLQCGVKHAFKNKIIVDYNVGSSNDVGEVYDSATINVKKDCTPKPDCDPNTDPTCCDEDDPTCCDEDDPDCKEEECDPATDPTCCDEDDPNCNDEEEECDPETDPSCKPGEETPPELPKTGPGEIALAIIAVVCIVTGGIYWYRSQKDLAKVQKHISGDKKK